MNSGKLDINQKTISEKLDDVKVNDANSILLRSKKSANRDNGCIEGQEIDKQQKNLETNDGKIKLDARSSTRPK